MVYVNTDTGKAHGTIGSWLVTGNLNPPEGQPRYRATNPMEWADGRVLYAQHMEDLLTQMRQVEAMANLARKGQ